MTIPYKIAIIIGAIVGVIGGTFLGIINARAILNGVPFMGQLRADLASLGKKFSR